MPGVKSPRMPESWAVIDGDLHCLDCRREAAGEAGIVHLPDDAPPGERQKLRSSARIAFEIGRDPEKPDNQIAKNCSTSIAAVREVRGRLGMAPVR
jgi:hypothetical protein